MDVASKLTAWMTQQRKDATSVTLVLYHLLVSTKEELLLEVTDVEPVDAALEATAKQFVAFAGDDAHVLAGVQSYLVRMRSGARDLGRFTFRMSGEENHNRLISSEPPTAEGLTAQLMRHNEVYARALAAMSTHAGQMAQREAESLRVQLRERDKTHLETIRLLEDLTSAKAKRDLDAQKAANEERRANDIYEKVSLILPTVVNRALGAKVLPEKSSPSFETIRALMSSLRPNQLQALQAVLEPEQLIALIELWKVIQAEDEAATKKQGPSSGSSN